MRKVLLATGISLIAMQVMQVSASRADDAQDGCRVAGGTRQGGRETARYAALTALRSGVYQPARLTGSGLLRDTDPVPDQK